jgi:hypothetical protein
MGSFEALIYSKLWHKQSALLNRRLAAEGCVYIPLILWRLAGGLRIAASFLAGARVAAPLLALGLLAAVPAGAQGPGSTPPPAATIPAFRFARHDGRLVSNADLPARKPVLFVFFDPDCDHCKRAVGHMDLACADYRAVAVYFVSMESQEKIDRFVATYAPRLAAQRNVLFLRDGGGGYMLGFNPVRFPSLFLYSSEHKLLDYEDNEETLFRIKRSIAALAGAGR